MKKYLKFFLLCILILSISGCGSFNNVTEDKEKDTVSQNDSKIQDKQSEEDTSIQEKEDMPIKDGKEADIEDNNIAENKDTNDKDNNASDYSKNKKIVVIDPGHGTHSNMEKEKQSPDSDIMKIKDGGGCQGVATNTPEYVVAMEVAQKLKTLLENNNITVIMTKTSNEESPGNIERANVGNDNNADLEIRIHCDSADNQSASGASMLVPDKVGYAVNIADKSNEYGEIILDNLISSSNAKNRGVITRDDLTGFNWSKVPVVLVEMGFMSNPNEDVKLNDDDYQNKLAEGLCNGIVQSLK